MECLCCYDLRSLARLDEQAASLAAMLAPLYPGEVRMRDLLATRGDVSLVATWQAVAATGWQRIQGTWGRCAHGGVCFWHCWTRYHLVFERAWQAELAREMEQEVA